jgi:fimbrial chaperone protein
MGWGLASTSLAQAKTDTVKQSTPRTSVGVATGTTSISPILINLAAGERATLTLRNDRTRAVFYQVTVLRWSQENGQDLYSRTEDFIASPPQFTMAAGSSQIIRMGFRKPVRSPTERAYRLMLVEVPQAANPPSSGGHIQFAMQYAIPVFVAGTTPTAPSPLVWQMQKQGNTMRVRADNPSNRRVVLNAVGLIQEAGPAPQTPHTLGQRATVLANAWYEWRIPIPLAEQKSSAAQDWHIVVKEADSAVWHTISDEDMRLHGR